MIGQSWWSASNQWCLNMSKIPSYFLEELVNSFFYLKWKVPKERFALIGKPRYQGNKIRFEIWHGILIRAATLKILYNNRFACHIMNVGAGWVFAHPRFGPSKTKWYSLPTQFWIKSYKVSTCAHPPFTSFRRPCI